MIGISKLYCGAVEPGDVLRYQRESGKLPSHLLQFSKDKKPVVVWNMSRRCNLKCIHCYAGSQNIDYPDELTTAEAKTMIADLAAFGAPVLLFSGGEPLMRADLPELAQEAVDRGMRAVISTNGTLITEEKAKIFREIGLSYVGVSLDGTEKTHDRFRGVPGAFAAAMKGIRICRDMGIKVGDPFIFGRGGEEAEVLREAGIPFEVVPGISSAVAVPAYAGIPLTHRNHTSTVAFVTGHEDPTKGKSDIDWPALAGIGTLVFPMGVKNLAAIAENLIRCGKAVETPAALIRRGTTPDQETLTGTLGDIARKAGERRFAPPSILVVGGVVGLREVMNWFETKPLFGRGIVITRPEAQAEELAELLRAQGARVISFPVIRIAPPESWDPLDQALGRLETYHWIVFTSANGVSFFFRRLRERGRDIRDLKGIRIATIGPATAAAVEALGIRVDLVPEEFISEGVIRAFVGEDLRGCRVLLPRAEQARDVIPEGLSEMGAIVDVAAAYRTVRSDRAAAEILPLLDGGKVDVVTFTSPSTVTHFLGIMGPDFRLPSRVRIACIGPVTAAAARKAGLTVDILQERYTIPELVDAISAHFEKEEGRMTPS